MPKVVYSNTKGLVQEIGSGFSFVTGTVADKVGLHLYQEEVSFEGSDQDLVVATLSKKLPQNSIIVKACITTSTAATSGKIELRIDSSLPEVGDDVAGTLIIGEETDTSVPDDDLDVSILGHTVVDLTGRNVADKVYLFLTSNVDVDVIGSPKVVVSVLYMGKGEPELI